MSSLRISQFVGGRFLSYSSDKLVLFHHQLRLHNHESKTMSGLVSLCVIPVVCLDFHRVPSQKIHALEWKTHSTKFQVHCNSVLQTDGTNRSTYPNGQQGRTGLKMSQSTRGTDQEAAAARQTREDTPS